MNILHIDCSTRHSSHSRQLSAAIVERLKAADSAVTVTRRDLGWHPIPHVEADHADILATAAAIMAADGSVFHRLSDPLIDELEMADVVVIGTPMHNFTVPSVLKAWIDQVLRVGRTILTGPDGKVGALTDRPVFIAVASGGVYSGEGANQPDFLTPYLSTALGCIGLTSLHFVPLQATAFTNEEALTAHRHSLAQGIGKVLEESVYLLQPAHRLAV
jgi:FMN-dependent NADH-azoreductase